MDHVDKIKKGSSSNNGSVGDPDHMVKLSVGAKSDSSKKSEREEVKNFFFLQGWTGDFVASHMIQTNEFLIPSLFHS